MGLLVQWLLYAIALMLVSKIVPGFQVAGLWPALIAALVIGLLNATVGLVLKVLTFPLSILTLGLFLLVGLLRALHAPALVVGPLALMWLLVYLGLYVWVIVDIISMEAERYWLWLIFLFGPPALVAYFIWGR